MEPEAQIRNLRDFLMVYNRMTEICFQRCTSNFNYRSLTMDEERCADSCAGKLIRSNHRLMGTYVNLMPGMVQRRMAEMEKKNAELVTAEAEAAGALEGTPDLADQGLPIASTGGKASAPAPGTSEAMTASEVSVMAASVLKPAVLDFSADVGPAASPSTPASEPLVPSSLSQAVNGVGLTRLTSGPILELSPVRHDQSTVTVAPSAAPSGPHLSR
uniref:LOW QUALITY PROTEIN: mitochondrial import inner membrane translocase subunit Tim10 B-like n=1 Tax=Oncorhynchus gorbuscha TaxID=8017 RepID=UPI001EAEF4C4|nr:LOW QUALITY PROTEIN: mitochondrial import inner membrane translocase subunit Tim10 B-like [Oncorhynchus gorbuscha]XP_046195002.1 mitochondrial import inner membrane translocase subunit Tim10 B-like [Oncorhynchus gorbuscha]